MALKKNAEHNMGRICDQRESSNENVKTKATWAQNPKERIEILGKHEGKGWENLSQTGNIEYKKCKEETMCNLRNEFVYMDGKTGTCRDSKWINIS